MAVSPTRRRLTGLRHDAQVELALRRLARFVRLEHEYGGQLNAAGLRLLRASTFLAYCDCRRLGVADRAAELLAGPAPEAPAPALTPTATAGVAAS